MKQRGCLVIGASGGIGYEISCHLAAKNYRLFIHGRDNEHLTALSKQLHSNTFIIKKDLRNRNDIHQLIEQLRPHSPDIDIVVIGFGPFLQSSIEKMSKSDYEYMFDMNLLLPALLITSLAPSMAERGWGRIIALGGTGTDQNRPYKKTAAYSAAKYALNSIVRSAAGEFGKKGVTVNLLTLGYVETEYYDEKTLDMLKKRGSVSASKIADVIDLLITNQSEVINGAIINAGATSEWWSPSS